MRFVVAPLLCLLSGCSIAAAQPSNSVQADDVYTANDIAQSVTDNSGYDANWVQADEAINAQVNIMVAAEHRTFVAWGAFLDCVENGLRAFSRQPEPAADVVRGAIGLCSGTRGDYEFALTEQHRANSPGDDARVWAERSAAATIHGLEDGLLGEVMAYRFERQVGLHR